MRLDEHHQVRLRLHGLRCHRLYRSSVADRRGTQASQRLRFFLNAELFCNCDFIWKYSLRFSSQVDDFILF